MAVPGSFRPEALSTSNTLPLFVVATLTSGPFEISIVVMRSRFLPFLSDENRRLIGRCGRLGGRCSRSLRGSAALRLAREVLFVPGVPFAYERCERLQPSAESWVQERAKR